VNTASPSGRAVTLTYCLLVAFCEGMDLQAAGVSAAGIWGEFTPNANQFGTFFSGSTFGMFFGAVIGGRLADSIGRKKVLVVSIALFGLFSLLTAFAMDVHSLIWARALTGLGLGGALPMLLALVTESTPGYRQSATVAMVYAAMPLGGAGISLLSLMIPASYWRVIFIVGGVIPLLLAPLMAVGLPESAAFQRARQAAAASPATLRAGSFMALLADGRMRSTLLLWISFLLALMLMYLLLNWLPTLMLNYGFTRVQAGGAQIGFNLGGVLSAVVIGYMLGGRLRNIAVIVTFVMLPVLFVSLAKSPPEFFLFASVLFVLGCAFAAAQAFLYATAPVTYPIRIRGMGVGAAVAFNRGPKARRDTQVRGPRAVAAADGFAAPRDRRQPVRAVARPRGRTAARRSTRTRQFMSQTHRDREPASNFNRLNSLTFLNRRRPSLHPPNDPMHV
jgi:MFS transporter, AAHS family, 3-hydroxyphenylpropionic acid transporter